MGYIIKYILIGLGITAIYDLIQQYLVKKESLRFTNWERVLLIFGWPIVITLSIIKNNKKEE